MPRRSYRALAATALISGALILATPAAAAPYVPTPEEIEGTRRTAEQRAQGAAALQQRLDGLTAQLRDLEMAAAEATEAFNVAREDAAKAQGEEATARAAATAAQQRAEESRRHLGRLAAATYRTGGELATVNLILDAGTERDLFDGVAVMRQITSSYQVIYRRFRAARDDAEVAAVRAREALLAKQEAAAQADRRREAAASAAATGQQRVVAVSEEREVVLAQLADARATTVRLEEARQAALQRAAEERARKEAEERARKEAAERAHAEAAARASAEAEERVRKEADRARTEAEERARKESEDRARAEAEERRRKEAEERARKEAEARSQAETATPARTQTTTPPAAQPQPQPTVSTAAPERSATPLREAAARAGGATPTARASAPAPRPASATPRPSTSTARASTPTATASTVKPTLTQGGGGRYTAAGAERAVAYVRAQLGKPYVWGGEGPNSFDCSGLTMRAWQASGVNTLLHSARLQYKATSRVSYGDLLPGDLIFWSRVAGDPSTIYHVAMYVGGGRMIHAPNPSRSVEERSVFYMGTPVGYGRV